MTVRLEFFEQRLVADNQPRLDERGFGLHVGVGHLHAIVNAAHRVADLQADVPQRIQHAVNQLGQIGQRLARRDLAVVQKHEINVAVRIQFRAAITADGHQRQRRKFLLRLRPTGCSRAVSQRCRSSASSIAARPGKFRVRPRRARCHSFSRCVSTLRKPL